MKNILNKIKSIIKEERGFAIVEATIVFPVMFFVLFFIIYIGNAYYQMAQMDSCVARAAIRGAQYVSDPQQYDMAVNGIFPVYIKDVEPYRYIFGELGNGSINKIEDIIADEVVKEVEGSMSFFSKMKPKITINKESIAEFNNYVLYSTFSVKVDYDIRFPIKFIGEEAPVIMKLSACAEVPVNDTTEFVRNVDMVVDLTSRTKFGKSVASMFSKVNSFLNTFAEK